MTDLNKTPRYDRFGTVSLDVVMPLIHADMDAPRKAERRYVSGKAVHVTSLRLRTFARHGITCKTCGCSASYFAIERDMYTASKDGHYHLNMWGYDKEGNDLLFTHDHVIARCLGGLDNLSNTTTMCGPCNWKKGEEERILHDKLKRGEYHG